VVKAADTLSLSKTASSSGSNWVLVVEEVYFLTLARIYVMIKGDPLGELGEK
jgi:hypothetical protein